MSVIASLAKAAAGAKLLTGTRPTTSIFPNLKWTLVVALALVAIGALISASQAPSTEHSSAASTNPEAGPAAPASEPAAASQMSERESLDAYGKLPLSFIFNEGQTDEAVRYYAQGAGYGFFFTNEGATLSFAEGKGRSHALALDFLEADPDATLTARKRLAGKINYLVGDNPTKWRQGLPTHAELLYRGLWPGIDMAVRGEGGKLKYEFHLKPGSSVDDVRLAYRGAEGLSVGTGGELLVRTSLGLLKDAAPVSYQRIGGERVPVESRYVLRGDGGYGFAVGAYDPHYPLVIDPGLDYSTFLGGAGVGCPICSEETDSGGIAVDGSGSTYVAGITDSATYPTTVGAFDTSFDGGFNGDAFVTKLNAAGSALDYSTFLGGTDSEYSAGIAVRDGSAYVRGTTASANYPTTPGAFDTSFNGSGGGTADAFVTKLNAAGSALDYSTFLGGTSFDEVESIAVDGSGGAYVTGDTQSADFPTTPGTFDTTFNRSGSGDAFVTKLNAAGSALVYSTFLGGRSLDEVESIAVDGSGGAYVTGATQSANYPTTPGAFDTSYNDNGDAFVTKLKASGSALVYSTFLGGRSFDQAVGIAVREGRAYVTGTTLSSDYPTTPGALDTSYNGDPTGSIFDAFVTKLKPSGSALAYSTFLGGSGNQSGGGIAVDGEGRAYVAGYTGSSDFPTTRGAFDTSFDGGFNDDAFVTKLNAAGSALAYSTFLGGTDRDFGWGIAVREGRAYVTGTTLSSDYPTTPGAFDTSFSGGFTDAFVTKLPTG
jgi:hypothetical protein